MSNRFDKKAPQRRAGTEGKVSVNLSQRSQTARSWSGDAAAKAPQSPRRRVANGDAVMSEDWVESHTLPILNFGNEEDSLRSHLAVIQEVVLKIEERLQNALQTPLALARTFRLLKN